MQVSDYLFNNLGHINNDVTDSTQRNIQNTRYTNLNITNYFSEIPNSQVEFVSKIPGLYYAGNIGPGLGPESIQNENSLFWGTEIERSYEKVQLFTRPFLTVPYLGRGSCDPTLESQLQQGQMVADKKSVSTVSEKSYIDYSTYPMMDELKSKIGNASYSVQEAAMDGWVRGGSSARETTTDSNFSKNSRPRDSGY